MANENYAPLIENMTWSWSRLKTFADCPYRWYLKYIAGLSGEEMFFSSYGKFIHDLLHRYYTGELGQNDLLPAYLTGFKSNVRGSPPSQKVFASYFMDGKRYFEHFEPLPFMMLTTEKRLDFNVYGIPFTAIIDYIGQPDVVHVVIADHKSRALKPRSTRKTPTKNDELIDEYLEQLYFYSIAIKQHFGQYPRELCLNCFRSRTLIREPFDRPKCRIVQQSVRGRVNQITQTNEFPPNLEQFKCRYICELHNQCEYYNINFGRR